MAVESRFGRALAMAEEVNEGDVRKGTDIPYLAVVVGVSALVREFGGNEDEAIAGLPTSLMTTATADRRPIS